MLLDLYRLWDQWAELEAASETARETLLREIRSLILPGSRFRFGRDTGWVCYCGDDLIVRVRIDGSDSTEKYPLRDFCREASPL